MSHTTGRGPGRVERLASRHPLLLAASVVGILASLVTIVVGVVELADRIDADPPVPTTIPTTAGPTPPPAEPTPSGGQPSAATQAQCWSATVAAAPCESEHRYELLPGGCDLPTLASYLGGRSDLDVPDAEARLGVVNDRCVLDPGRTVVGSAAGILASSGDDAWRLCYDTAKASYMNCSLPHAGEFVATGRVGRATLAECTEAAETYLDQSLAELPELQVQAVTTGRLLGGCFVSARGSQHLTASVRSLGPNTLPLSNGGSGDHDR